MALVTPFQTVGPFLTLGLRDGVGTPARVDDRTVVVTGRLIDGAGAGVPDGVLEVWHAGQRHLVRAATADDGTFIVQTIRPGPVAATDSGGQAPHLAVRVLARGILTEYLTRIYFSDEPANATDAVLQLVPADRRGTLIADRAADGTYRFDVVLQGGNETVFFDHRP
jgi:protocatechuate 3,4-dioxygenase alpha subunit